MTKQKPQGILLCEVGNISDPITSEGRERLKEVLESAFKETGAAKHGPPQFFWSNDEFFWSNGETMAASKAEAQEHDSDEDWNTAIESEPDGYTDEVIEREADEDQMSQESKDEINSIGFALAKSLALLPEFTLPKNCKNCIDSASFDFMRNVCSEEDI